MEDVRSRYPAVYKVYRVVREAWQEHGQNFDAMTLWQSAYPAISANLPNGCASKAEYLRVYQQLLALEVLVWTFSTLADPERTQEALLGFAQLHDEVPRDICWGEELAEAKQQDFQRVYVMMERHLLRSPYVRSEPTDLYPSELVADTNRFLSSKGRALDMDTVYTACVELRKRLGV